MARKVKYSPSPFMAKDSHYDKESADFAVDFIRCLSHTKGTWAGKPFELIPWQEQIIRYLFGILKPNGCRQFNTAYIEIPKKQGKSELAAAVALLLTCGDGEERAEVYVSLTSVDANVGGTGIITASLEGEALSVGSTEPVTAVIRDKNAEAY